MKNNNAAGLLKALIFAIRERNEFSLLQAKYLLYEFMGLDKKAEESRIKTLKEYIGLKESTDCFILDDLKFRKVDGNLIEPFIGMCLDIFLKDRFYLLKDESLRRNMVHNLLFYFYQEGPYEIDEVQVYENDTVIDAGANMGMFSILSAKKGARVYSFEPQDIFYKLLKENCVLNALDTRIQSINYAVSSHEGSSALSVNSENLLAASINIDRKGESRSVMCTSIDHWAYTNNISKIDFIKADIEGAERLLLDGAVKTIRQFKPRLAFAAYHLPDDKEILKKKILDICPEYKIIQTRKILFAY